MSTRTLTVAVFSILVLLSLGTNQVLADGGDWMIRSRLIVISPDTQGTDEFRDLDVESNFTMEADLTYFFSKNWAIEAMITTSTHSAVIKENEGPRKAFGRDFSLGSLSLLPPTVLVQYHFLPDGKLRPYLGIGLNYTVFYEQTGALDSLEKPDSSFGFAAQTGIDFMITDTMSINVDLKYIAIDTDIDNREGPMTMGSIELDPLVFGVGVGWHF